MMTNEIMEKVMKSIQYNTGIIEYVVLLHFLL